MLHCSRPNLPALQWPRLWTYLISLVASLVASLGSLFALLAGERDEVYQDICSFIK